MVYGNSGRRLRLIVFAALVALGLALLWSPHALTHGISVGTSPSWHAAAFSVPLAMLAYTGLETVANLAEETRRPGVQLPKSLFGGIGAVVAVYVGIAVVGLMAFPVHAGTTQLGERWQGAPLMGIVAALDPHIASWLQTPLRVYVGLSGAVILLLAASTSVSGFGRLAYSLGEHGQLPRAFGRLHRRMLVAPESVLGSWKAVATTEWLSDRRKVSLPEARLRVLTDWLFRSPKALSVVLCTRS